MRNPIIQTSVLACCAVAIALTAAAASSATAQTLTDPYPHQTPSHPAAEKPAAAKHMKACPEFGAGFYRVAGSNTCVKVGGFIDAGVTGNR